MPSTRQLRERASRHEFFFEYKSLRPHWRHSQAFGGNMRVAAYSGDSMRAAKLDHIECVSPLSLANEAAILVHASLRVI